MDRHTLGDSALVALGAGRPDAATSALLRRAAYGRHLLLVRELVRAAPVETRQWYADLRAAERIAPAPTRARLADPLFGAWAAHTLRTVRRGDRWPGEPPTPAFPAPHVQDRREPDDDAAAPTQTAQPTGPPNPPYPAPQLQDRREPDDDAATPTQKTQPTGPPNPPYPAPQLQDRREPDRPAARVRTARPSGTVLTAEHGGLVLRVRLEDRDPRRGLLGLEPAGPLTDDRVAHWQACLTAAWRLLVERHTDAARVLAAVLDVVVPVRPDPAARGISASSADAYGAVAVSEPEDGTSLAVGLLHEAQHSVLNAVLHLFDLLEAPDTPGYSPWRDDPRPLSGLLHGAYAYLAVARFWRAEAAATGDRLAAFEFARWRAAVAEAADRLLRDGRPTAVGARFVGALRDEVRPWLAEPVDPEAERLARLANADHRLRWRLRNLAVAPEQARALATAWRRGDPPPPVEARLVPAPRRALENSDRLNRMHRLLNRSTADPGTTNPDEPDPGRAGPTATHPAAGAGHLGGHVGAGTAEPATHHLPGGRVSGGDDALLAGNHGAAVSAYLERVVSEPADDAAWTGLALLAGGLDRVEVVAAGYRALPDRPDPLAFAGWISG